MVTDNYDTGSGDNINMSQSVSVPLDNSSADYGTMDESFLMTAMAQCGIPRNGMPEYDYTAT